MKFRVYLFREHCKTFEVEAENHDDALAFVDKLVNELDPVQTEMFDYLPKALVAPILANGEVDYDSSRWFE